jgi:predicted transglutaminase-like cysteine proteinase
MGFLVYARLWRAGIVACGLMVSGAADLRAEMLETSASPAPSLPSEPFGLASSAVEYGGLRDKWLAVQHRLDDDMVQLALCDGDRDGCVSQAALRFLDIVDIARRRDGRARFGEINRAINLSIRATDDLAQHGQPDVWSSPLATFEAGRGDCEDYAIAKFAALRHAGIAPDDLRIVIMHDTVRDQYHAVAAARLDGRWLLLDNRRMAMILDGDIRNLRPTFVIGQHGVMRYIDSALLASAWEPDTLASPAVGALPTPANASFILAD